MKSEGKSGMNRGKQGNTLTLPKFPYVNAAFRLYNPASPFAQLPFPCHPSRSHTAPRPPVHPEPPCLSPGARRCVVALGDWRRGRRGQGPPTTQALTCAGRARTSQVLVEGNHSAPWYLRNNLPPYLSCCPSVDRQRGLSGVMLSPVTPQDECAPTTARGNISRLSWRQAAAGSL
ncbi:hypothetical protein E2C01_053514 [Portunus trituberculatus]|uniref:Uncharacterized protein n=1 Tax=Portunus trituberculatus TaxID=210409 RepID=A0A5B7GSA7_PORTR|nr:hypothetical protein [Portunus trituberculatus]